MMRIDADVNSGVKAEVIVRDAKCQVVFSFCHSLEATVNLASSGWARKSGAKTNLCLGATQLMCRLDHITQGRFYFRPSARLQPAIGIDP